MLFIDYLAKFVYILVRLYIYLYVYLWTHHKASFRCQTLLNTEIFEEGIMAIINILIKIYIIGIISILIIFLSIFLTITVGRNKL